MKEKRWILRKDYDIEVVEKLADSLGVDKIIATLLVERGVTTFEEAKHFFRPSLDQLHDPFLMKDMDRAIVRINDAIRYRERMLIYGDYDVDGTSAVALVYSYFHTLHYNIDFYIPDRDTEGYGISFQGIDYAKRTGVKLIIALDCGIKAIEQAEYAKQFGIDIIVGDHHLPGETLPDCVAVLDPKRADCPYPYKELSGCGIGFKIVEAYMEQKIGVRLCDSGGELTTIQKKNMEMLKLKLLRYLDLVAVSIASDIVPMTGENRVLAAFGLKVINTCPRPGLEAILTYGHIEPRSKEDRAVNPDKESYFVKDLNISDLVFLVGPRINAAGRIHSAFDSVRLLLAESRDVATRLAEEINNYNKERKDLDTQATEEAKRRLESDRNLSKRHSIVLFGEGWHRGVVGIVASRLVEAYYRPTIVLTRSTDDLFVGSARSIKEFDVHAALEECSELLEHFGGHKSAAGVSLRPENFDRFVERFEEIVSRTMPPEASVPEVEIDAVVRFSDITPKFLRILKQFSPFGPDNNVPVFCTRNLESNPMLPPRVVGSNHLKFSALSSDSPNSYPAIGFQLGEYYERVNRQEMFDVCYQLEENYWRGKTEIQLNVKDIRFDNQANTI
ncbi:MAG: single-stranded-DNA-specific exonuclease RecJ [Bacteroidales bacterium]|nr:single-stranded-DNA-specific exonuclease RecJ [Bacteroidales bacterium]